MQVVQFHVHVALNLGVVRRVFYALLEPLNVDLVHSRQQIRLLHWSPARYRRVA